MIRVAILDDHKMFVEGLTKIINESQKATVIRCAHTAKDGDWMLAMEKENVDVLLLDVNLPDGSGTDLCRQWRPLYPNLKILALTTYAEHAVIMDMLSAGANGYVLKNAMAEEILEGIMSVHRGEQFLCHEVDMMLHKSDFKPVLLTRREKEMLTLIAEGETNVEIAKTMHLGVETVKSYRKNLLLKLGAKNTAILVKMAIEQKLV
ncbi:MAG: response regulator transcription factor [Bacteroidales bacterium]|jgi:DNA-binding NarL/FixJ family response regulator|nr:response regulator transcription factor [Bacteroidales bacterium]